MLKIKLTPSALKLAYKFIDVESLGESAVLDGRTIEYGFAISRLARLPVGRLLDIGCVSRVNPVVSTMCELGWKVCGIDIRDYKYSHPHFTFVKGDICHFSSAGNYDAVTAISTLEHIGIKGRYGIEEDCEESPFRALDNIRAALKPGGTLIITLPNKSKKSNLEGTTAPIINKLLKSWNVKSMRIDNNLTLLELVKE